MHLKYCIFFFVIYHLLTITEGIAQIIQDNASHNISITITNIRSSKGTIYVAIFYNDEHFQKSDNFERIPYRKKDLVDGTLKVSMYVKPGIVGLSLLDDEDNDGEMNKNFLGIPREGFGFSNYYHTGFNHPVFDDFKFEVRKGEHTSIAMKIRYL